MYLIIQHPLVSHFLKVGVIHHIAQLRTQKRITHPHGRVLSATLYSYQPSPYLFMKNLQQHTLTILGAILALIIIGGSIFTYMTPTLVIENYEDITYTNDTYGVTFSYSSAYKLEEMNLTDKRAETGLILVLTDRNFVPVEGGEGPVAITLALLDGPHPSVEDEAPVDTWIRTEPFSNFKLSPDQLASRTQLAGKDARIYAWDGLYPGTSVVTTHKGNIVMASVTYQGADDPIKKDFTRFLDSIVFSGSDIEVPLTVRGSYQCLPHKNTGGITTMECAFGIETKNGDYYALDMQGLPQNMINTDIGTIIEITGTLTPIEAISSGYWSAYPIEGIVRVSSFKEL